MSMGIGHFAAGASVGLAVIHSLSPSVRRKVNNFGVLAIITGTWAMIPDIAKLIPSLKGLHDTEWANLFFLHKLLDVVDKQDSVWVSAGFVGLMLIIALTLVTDEFWEKHSNVTRLARLAQMERLRLIRPRPTQ